MRDIDPVSIRLFLAALEEGSIARAAAREAIETICTLVARGMGVGVVPLYLKAAKEKSLGLRFVPLVDDWAKPRSFVAVRDYDTLPVAAQAFVAHLRASAALGGD